jgi:hypothetical protein
MHYPPSRYLILVDDPSMLASIWPEDSARYELVRTSNWKHFLFALSDATVACVYCQSVAREWPARIAEIKLRYPYKPLVVVTTPDAKNLQPIAAVPIDEVIWWSDAARDLLPACARLETTSFRQESIARVRAAEQLPTALRTTLVHVLRRGNPATSITAIVGEVGYARTTLWEHWNSHVDRRVRLLEFVDWVFLLHVVSRKTRNRTWASVATELDVDSDTVTRRVRKLLNMSLRDLENEGYQCVVNAFKPYLDRVLGTSSGEAPNELSSEPPSELLAE